MQPNSVVGKMPTVRSVGAVRAQCSRDVIQCMDPSCVQGREVDSRVLCPVDWCYDFVYCGSPCVVMSCFVESAIYVYVVPIWVVDIVRALKMRSKMLFRSSEHVLTKFLEQGETIGYVPLGRPKRWAAGYLGVAMIGLLGELWHTSSGSQS